MKTIFAIMGSGMTTIPRSSLRSMHTHGQLPRSLPPACGRLYDHARVSAPALARAHPLDHAPTHPITSYTYMRAPHCKTPQARVEQNGTKLFQNGTPFVLQKPCRELRR